MSLRKRVVALLRPWLPFVLTGVVLTGALMALVLSAFPSLSYGQAYVRTMGPEGIPVLVLELPNVKCPGSEAGCYAQHVILGYGGDSRARQHELDHVAGMRHGPWYRAGNGDNCAVITQSGMTRWTFGRLMCRRQDGVGDYYEVEQ